MVDKAFTIFGKLLSALTASIALAALAACSSSSQHSEEPLYRSGGIGVEARLTAVERGISEFGRELSRRDRMIAELEQEVIALKRALEAVGPARESLRSDAAAARSTLSQRIGRLESRLAGLDAARDATARQLDALRGMAGQAMQEAEQVRSLINQREAERVGAGVDLTAPNSEDQDLEPTPQEIATDADRPSPKPTMPPDGFAVHLASYTTQEAAREGWEDLKTAHPDLLGEREARLKLLDLGNLGGRYLRLLAGPFSDVAPANEVCERLRESGNFCQVAAFSGDPVPGRTP